MGVLRSRIIHRMIGRMAELWIIDGASTQKFDFEVFFVRDCNGNERGNRRIGRSTIAHQQRCWCTTGIPADDVRHIPSELG